MIRTSLVIAGFTGSPDSISTLLEEAPHEVGVAGEEKPRGSRSGSYIVRDSYWLYRSTETSSLDLADGVAELVGRFHCKHKELSALPDTVIRKIEICVSLTPGDCVPGLHLPADLAGKLSEMGLALDLDIN